MALAPPVEKDGFAYAGDTLYAEASSHNRHRRATLPELKELFQPTSGTKSGAKDPAAHWYEAQLIHYGLPPSKTKSVAKVRLLDAFNKGGMAVPQHLQKLETELKKQWNKNERQARKERKDMESKNSGAVDKEATGRKTTKEPEKIAKKDGKAKTTKQAGEKEDKSTGTKEAGKKRKLDDGASEGTAPLPPAKKAATAKPKSTAASSTTKAPPEKSKAKAACRRRGGPDHHTMQDASYDSYDERRNASDDAMQVDSLPPPPQGNNRLGLINGKYNVQTSIDGQWAMFDGHRSTIILTLHGDQIWGSYDFGMFSGIICIAGRPYDASGSPIDFNWRGRENSENVISYDDNDQTGTVAFSGGGVIGGTFDGLCGEVSFQGLRVSGQQTRSERGYQSLRREWDSYSYEEYEYARVNRWR